VINISDLRAKLEAIIDDIKSTKQKIGLSDKISKIEEIEKSLSDESLWNDAGKLNTLMKEKSNLSRSVELVSTLEKQIYDAVELLNLAESENDHSMLSEIDKLMESWIKRANEIKISSVFVKEEDYMDCFMEINAGAGGTDSQDWVEMLLRMYLIWANKKSFNAQVIHRIDGEEAGIKQVMILVTGYLAYGHLKVENGIHRLVRISPFNSNGKRQTSFASVFCYPAIDDKIEVAIEEKDLRIDIFRSSGPGGQSVNTTDSAVRITHIPTGIVVQSQDQRSQIQNRAVAMKTLRAKLYDAEIKKRNTDKQAIEDSKSDIAWGHQIRNYVLYPYKLIKDTRSNYETSQALKVLDGELDEIIESVLLTDRI